MTLRDLLIFMVILSVEGLANTEDGRRDISNLVPKMLCQINISQVWFAQSISSSNFQENPKSEILNYKSMMFEFLLSPSKPWPQINAKHSIWQKQGKSGTFAKKSPNFKRFTLYFYQSTFEQQDYFTIQLALMDKKGQKSKVMSSLPIDFSSTPQTIPFFLMQAAEALPLSHLNPPLYLFGQCELSLIKNG